MEDQEIKRNSKMELSINIGDEYKVKIEDGENFSKSIFNELYMNAA